MQGHPDARPVLVVNADDYGLTAGVCEGILAAHRDGIVTSTSVLVPARAFVGHAARLRDVDIGVGLHLCAVGEDPPLLSAREVPTLVDRHGHLPATWKGFCRRAVAGRVDPHDLARELGAQAEAALQVGLRLTHVDAHQNLQLWPAFGDVAIQLARRLGVRVLRVTRTQRWSPRALGVRALGTRLRQQAAQAGLVVPPHAVGLDEAGRMDTETLCRSIEDVRRRAMHTDLTLHPGAAHDPDRLRFDWSYHWGDELAAACSPEASRAVRRSGLRTGTFADLAQALAPTIDRREHPL